MTGDLGMLIYALIPSHPKLVLLAPLAPGTPEEQSLAEPSLPSGHWAMASPLHDLYVLGHDEDGLLIEGYFY